MNIKEYISSGIVESYVLGLATEQERSEFEQLCRQYPELVAARNEFEKQLEKQAFDHAIPPPAFLKEKVLSSIREQESIVKEAKLITMDTKPRSNGLLKFVAAAAIILLLGSAYFAYSLYSDKEEMKKSSSQMQANLDSTNKQMDELKKMMEIITNPNNATVVVSGTQPGPSSASVYWDTASKDVYMMVKNMPQLPSDKQYQLWAFIGGKPLDLGLFDASKPNLFLKMNNTQKADAFAITIEKRGNGPAPKGDLYGQKGL